MFALLFLVFFLLFLILVLLLGLPIVLLHFLLHFLLHACLCCRSLENNLGCRSLHHCNFLHFVFLVIGFVLLLRLFILLHDCTCRKSLENCLHGRSLYHCRFLLLGLSLLLLLLLLMFALLFLVFFLLFLILVLLLGLPIVLLHFLLHFLGCWLLRALLRSPLCDRCCCLFQYLLFWFVFCVFFLLLLLGGPDICRCAHGWSFRRGLRRGEGLPGSRRQALEALGRHGPRGLALKGRVQLHQPACRGDIEVAEPARRSIQLGLLVQVLDFNSLALSEIRSVSLHQFHHLLL